MSLALFFSQSKARVGWEILGFSDFGLFQSDKILGKKMKMAWLASHIEVNRLVKGRPLDNLEFLQWLKRYCDSVNGGIMNENYNPVERRSKGGKDRNSKGSQKTTKSLHANNMHNSASGDTVDLNKMSGPKQGTGSAVAGGATYSEEIEALSKEVTNLKLSVDHLEKEKDFYFAVA
ncbi:hypothetical protein OIU84_001708 [Salix udensis]|uniref:Uncharacterized protein n=1 Tax=Salix udensis TaxID=889485 RepID=A0AAD6K9W1_9ROSI|nr:hypothetical protein OIU84_001708 [Salix udensis]